MSLFGSWQFKESLTIQMCVFGDMMTSDVIPWEPSILFWSGTYKVYWLVNELQFFLPSVRITDVQHHVLLLIQGRWDLRINVKCLYSEHLTEPHVF